MQKSEIINIAKSRLTSAFSNWNILESGDYGKHPVLQNSIREAKLEAVARSLLIAVPLIINGNTELIDIYKTKLLYFATNPDYLPKSGFDQATVEVAGICSCLLMLQHHGINILQNDYETIYRWISQYKNARVMNNNWKLFNVVINMWIYNNWNFVTFTWTDIDKMYNGDGWYHDGFNGHVDYYTAYSFHWYSLVLAITCNLPPIVKQKIIERALAFSFDIQKQLKQGYLPIKGRSQCYREAVSAPLALVEILVPGSLQFGNFVMEKNFRQYGSQEYFEGVEKNLYSCSASPMWRNKWLWQSLIKDESEWWKVN